MKDGNLSYALLGLLACHEGGAHGYRLQREACALCEHSSLVTHGRVYRSLGDLERRGEVAASREQQDGRPNRRIYRLTPRGRRVFETWIAQPPCDHGYPLKDELALKLKVAGSGDFGMVAELVGGYRSMYLERLESITRRRAVLRRSGLDPVLGELVGEACRSRVQAELAWLESLERSLIRDRGRASQISPRPS
jgi:DNA-binding PadR family transcriptional regulator